MSLATDAIRPFWLSGLNNISGNVTKPLASWFCDEEFQVYDHIQPDSFSLYITTEQALLSAFAFDCNRMAIAAFETISGITQNNSFPKSTAWLIIRSYYAAFFAAHAILRMLGISCSQINTSETSSIYKIADLYGNANEHKISQGYYKCSYDNGKKKLFCKKLSTSAGGVHESFWAEFYQSIKRLSNDILKYVSQTKVQQVSVKLADLCDNMSYGQCNNGNWLSYIRNEVNYRHLHGTWYPYRNYKNHYEQLHNDCKAWDLDPMGINLRFQKGKELHRFQASCSFVIALCKVLVIDMAGRCPKGKSFHYFGSLAFLKLLSKSSSKAKLL